MPPRRHKEDFDSHDTAQICLNGHWISGSYHDAPEFREPFCKHCGSRTIIQCEHCHTEIRGFYRDAIPSLERTVPAFCHGCGKPHPWVAAKIHAAKAMVSELQGLTDADRLIIQTSIDDIAANTPMTEVAVVRVKKLIPKVLSSGGEALRKLIVDVASETAAKALKG
ncbi:MAG TPA: DUF2321 domain-containing protein [Vicinamibacterales bacterium]|nr:DUF2321 domain-containing protein [Vicinamibacterales bacterium]